MTTPETLANQIRALCNEVNNKAEQLRAEGYTVDISPYNTKSLLTLSAKKTVEIQL